MSTLRNRRRDSVSLHELVLQDPAAKQHYEKLRNGESLKEEEECNSLPTPPCLDGGSWSDGSAKVTFDPILLAESLLLEEEENDDDASEMKDDMKSLLPGKKISSNNTRRQSAIREQDRVRQILLDAGLLME